MFKVKWKRQGEWITVFTSNLFAEALHYANNNIVHGHTTQRIEVHDGTSALRCVYDSHWGMK